MRKLLFAKSWEDPPLAPPLLLAPAPAPSPAPPADAVALHAGSTKAFVRLEFRLYGDVFDGVLDGVLDDDDDNDGTSLSPSTPALPALPPAPLRAGVMTTLTGIAVTGLAFLLCFR